jgi:hypothetical protein
VDLVLLASTTMHLLDLESALLLRDFPEFRCITSWAYLLDFTSAAARASSLVEEAWGRPRGRGTASTSSPSSDEEEEGGVEEVSLGLGRRGCSVAKSPGAGEEGPTRTQSSPAGLSLLGREARVEEVSCSSPQIMEEMEENMTRRLLLLLLLGQELTDGFPCPWS